MQQFSKKTVAMIVLAILVIGGVVFGGWKCWEGKNIHIITTQNQNGLDDGTTDAWLNDVKDYIDGEYVFESMDTSDWKTFRNDKVGYEIKIPQDWFCNGDNTGSAEEYSYDKVMLCGSQKNENHESWIKLYFYPLNRSSVGEIQIKNNMLSRYGSKDFAQDIKDAKKYGYIYTTYLDETMVLMLSEDLDGNLFSIFNPLQYWEIEKYSHSSEGKMVTDQVLKSFHFIK